MIDAGCNLMKGIAGIFTKLKKDNRGFTLIEMMVVIIILGFVFTAAYSLLNGFSTVVEKQRGKIDARNDVRLAMNQIVKEIESSSGVALSGSVCYVTQPSGTTAAYYYDHGRKAVIRDVDGKQSVFIESLDYNRNPFSVTAEGNKYEIRLVTLNRSKVPGRPETEEYTLVAVRRQTDRQVVVLKAIAPTANPVPGVYGTAQNVSLSTPTNGGAIRVSTDNINWQTYTGPISVPVNTTIYAYTEKAGMKNSDKVTFYYGIKAAAPTASPAPGTYTSGQNVTLSTATAGGTIYYSLDGSNFSTYSSPINVSSSKIITAYTAKGGMENSDRVSFAYTINLEDQGPDPIFTKNPISAYSDWITDKGQLIGGGQKREKDVIFEVKEAGADGKKVIKDTYNGNRNYTADSMIFVEDMVITGTVFLDARTVIFKGDVYIINDNVNGKGKLILKDSMFQNTGRLYVEKTVYLNGTAILERGVYSYQTETNLADSDHRKNRLKKLGAIPY